MIISRASLAQLSDAEALLNEYYDAVGVIKRDSLEEVRGFLSDAAGGFWIAYVEQVAVGCVVLRSLPSMGGAAECKRLYVRSSFRRLGIADALLDALEIHARLAGCSWIYLDSKDDLEAALRLYEKRGYGECDRYNDNPQATVFLRKDLRQFAPSITP